MTAPYIAPEVRRRQDPRRPYVDPKLARHRPTLDSLFAATGGAPDSVVSRSLRLYDRHGVTTEGFYNPETRTVTISPVARDPRAVAAHEVGHVLMHQDPELFYRFVDEVLRETPRIDTRGRRIPRVAPEQAEAFADALRDAFDALSRRDTVAAQRPRLRMLSEYLNQRPPFAEETDSVAADSVPLRPPSDDRPRPLRRRGAP